ncbi:MAG: arsenate reductase ArsC, partial [Candidatus Riflebacteria bacterium]|nr:arsenate reductase ArsC [Candidatus Riflebacteria bacterium]
MKHRLLLLCTGNSCRSQMAEAWARHLWPDLFEVFSAGIEAHGLNPHAVAVMAEKGLDMTGHRSKTLADLPTRDFDFVVTVCGHADEACPIFPAKTRKIHHGFDDPPRLAKEAKTPEEALAHYRRVRDEIAAFVRRLPSDLGLS